MPRPSPFARGFRVLRREPIALLAEIAWRWVFSGIASALCLWAVFGFLHAIEVSKGNQFLLRSLNPTIIAYVLRDLLSQKWGLAARLAAIVSVSLSVLWIALSTVARCAILRVLIERVGELWDIERETRFNFRSVLAIQFLRVAMLWVGALAYVVIAIISGLLTQRGEHSDTGVFLLLFLLFFGFTATVLSLFNWVLLLAPIYAVRDGSSFADATLSAWRLTRTRGGSFTALNLAHLALRLVWFVFMSGVVFVPFGFASVLPKLLIFLAWLLITLVYCAVADVLFVGRYSGYIEIAEQELHPEPQPAFAPPPPYPVPPNAPVIPQA